MFSGGSGVISEQSLSKSADGLKNHVSPVRSRPSAQTKTRAKATSVRLDTTSIDVLNHVVRTAGRATKAVFTEDGDKRRAMGAVARAIRSGELVKPSRCACGSDARLEAHHPRGYDRAHQLDVDWLCKVCHIRAHGKRSTRNFAIPEYARRAKLTLARVAR